MLVEDSQEDVDLFIRILRQSGVEIPIHVVSDGDEAIAYFKGEGNFADRDKFPLPCGLFLDLKMRRVDGWEVLRWIQTQEHLQKMLIVVLTVFQGPKFIMEAYRLGAHSFLVKPLSPQDVKNLVQYFGASLAHGARNEVVLGGIAKLMANMKAQG